MRKFIREDKEDIEFDTKLEEIAYIVEQVIAKIIDEIEIDLTTGKLRRRER